MDIAGWTIWIIAILIVAAIAISVSRKKKNNPADPDRTDDRD